ncbi:MAG: hypothetical protein WD535_02845, partial [Thermaerobacterales bacterium]
AEFARVFTFLLIRWLFVPGTFVLIVDEDGQIEVGFTPDFYLPDYDLFVELTTSKPHLMGRKERKVEALKQDHGINVKLLDRSGYHLLLQKLAGRGPVD